VLDPGGSQCSSFWLKLPANRNFFKASHVSICLVTHVSLCSGLRRAYSMEEVMSLYVVSHESICSGLQRVLFYGVSHVSIRSESRLCM